MTTADRKQVLSDVHSALRRYRDGERTARLGREVSRLLDLHDTGTVLYGKDALEDLYGAFSGLAESLRGTVEDLLNVLADDAEVPAIEVEYSENGEPHWGFPVYASHPDIDSDAYGLCDLFAAEPEEQADYLWEQMQEAY